MWYKPLTVVACCTQAVLEVENVRYAGYSSFRLCAAHTHTHIHVRAQPVAARRSSFASSFVSWSRPGHPNYCVSDPVPAQMVRKCAAPPPR